MQLHDFAVMAMLLGACTLIATLGVRRSGGSRDARLMGAIGVALSGVALVLLSFGGTQ